MKYLACALSVVALSACSTNPAPNMSAQSVTPAAERTNTQNADISTLQGITRNLIDASSLYSAAAQDSENVAYKAQLNALSDRRRTMTNLFQAHVAGMGAARWARLIHPPPPASKPRPMNGRRGGLFQQRRPGPGQVSATNWGLNRVYCRGALPRSRASRSSIMHSITCKPLFQKAGLEASRPKGASSSE